MNLQVAEREAEQTPISLMGWEQATMVLLYVSSLDYRTVRNLRNMASDLLIHGVMYDRSDIESGIDFFEQRVAAAGRA